MTDQYNPDEGVEESALHDSYQFDFGRVSSLLSIVQGIADIAPQYSAIANEALSELKELNEECIKVQAERAEAERQNRAKRDAELRAQAQAQAEESDPTVTISAEREAANREMDMAGGALSPNPQPSPPKAIKATAENTGGEDPVVADNTGRRV